MRAPERTSKDLGVSFSTLEEASLGACDHLAKEPRDRPFERTGCIFEGSDGLLRVGMPVLSDVPGFCMTPDPPVGARLVGEYHDHLRSEEFSTIDLNTSRKVAQVLCTPSGGVLLYEPGTSTRKLK